MEMEDIKNALFEAFKEYWRRTTKININGRVKTKSKYSQLQIDENAINLLKGVICCNDAPMSIKGLLEAFIQTESKEGEKSIRLQFTIRPDDYSITIEDNKKPIITINNVSFSERKI